MQLFLPLHPEYVGVLSDFCSSYPLLYHIIILRLLISRTSIVYFKSLTTWSVLSLANYILGLKFAIICLASHMYISSVQSFSRVRLFATPWITARQATLSITNSRSSLRLLSIESVMPFSHLILCRPLLLLPASESFPMSQLFAWGGQSTGVSALASFLPKKSQGWSPSEWIGWMSLQSKGLSRVFSNTTVQKHQFFGAQPSSQSNSHIHIWPQEKP